MASSHLVDPNVPPTGLSIGIMTSGGDAQGMNAAIRAVVRRACVLGASVWAIYEGYMGMVQGGDMIRNLKWDDVSGLLPKVRLEGSNQQNTVLRAVLAAVALCWAFLRFSPLSLSLSLSDLRSRAVCAFFSGRDDHWYFSMCGIQN